MPKSTRNKIESRSTFIGVLVGLAVWGLSIWFCAGTWHGWITAHAKQKWHAKRGIVTAVTSPLGGQNGPYVVGTINFPGWSGQASSTKAVLNYHTAVGNYIEVDTNRSGGLYVPADLNSDPMHDPRNPYTQSLIVLGIFGGLVVGIMAGVLSFAGGCLSSLVAWDLWHRPPLVIVLRHFTRRAVLWVLDGIKLQWEFHQQAKRINATPAFKAARRFQAQLRRMEPPKGITPPENLVRAKHRANELLTKVLERDYVEVTYVEAQIAEILQGVESDISTRKDALEDLKQSEA